MERFTKYFTNLGGALTSLAAIIGGIVALYVAFGGGGGTSDPPQTVVTTPDAGVDERAADRRHPDGRERPARPSGAGQDTDRLLAELGLQECVDFD